MLVGETQIKAQALKFANQEMQIKDLQLKFTDGWMRHFKRRHGLHYKKARGEARSADFAAAEEWVANRYAHERIFFGFCIRIIAIEGSCTFALSNAVSF